MKTTLKIVGIVIAVLTVVLIALPFVIDVNMFRPQIEAELTSALGRQVKVGNLKLSLLGESVSADDLAIADDPAFGRDPFVRAKELKVGVELMPLVFSKTLNVTNLSIDQPQISLVHSADGKWNYSSIGGSKPETGSATGPARAVADNKAGNASQKENKAQLVETSARLATAPAGSSDASNPNLSVAELDVKNGSVSIVETSSNAKPRTYQNVDITVKVFSFTSQFPFTLTASLPGGGTTEVDGKAGPIDATDASMTHMDANITVKQLDLAASSFVNAASGIAGIVNFDGTLNSDGLDLRTNGTATAEKLKLSPKGSPANKAVNLKYATVFELQKQTGQLTQGDVTLGQAVAHLTGTYQAQQNSTILNMRLNADNMPVNDLETMLPALGIVLPWGSSLQGGTLTADLAISGPVDKLVITGPVKLANTKLAGFDLTSKLSEISKFTGGGQKSSDTTIQNFSTDVRVAPEGINTQNVNLNVPAIGVITGAGTISPQNELNYTMNASLNGAMGGLTQLAGGFGNKGAGLPFFIQGTTSDPKFVPDVKGMLNNQLGNLKGLGQGQQNPANSIVNGLGGLLGKKKQ
jgi:AsmA protein